MGFLREGGAFRHQKKLVVLILILFIWKVDSSFDGKTKQTEKANNLDLSISKENDSQKSDKSCETTDTNSILGRKSEEVLEQQGEWSKNSFLQYNMRNLGPFFTSYIGNLISELCDKTFFLTVMLAAKFSRKAAFFGSAGAHAILTLISSLFGQILFQIVSPKHIHLASIVIFIVYGLSIIKQILQTKEESEEKEAEEDFNKISDKVRKSSQEIKQKTQSTPSSNFKLEMKFLAISFTQIFLGEFGDKSQLMTIALSGYSQDILQVFFGSVLGQITSIFLAAMVGKYFKKYCSLRVINVVYAILTFIFILYSIYDYFL